MQDKGKTIFAALYALAVTVLPFFDGGARPSVAEWVSIAIAVVTVFAVYIAPMIPQAPGVKSALAALLAALQVLVVVITDGVNGNDVLLIAAAVAGALGIALAPATSANGVHVGWGRDSYDLAA